MISAVVTAFICGTMFGLLLGFIFLLIWTKVNTDELEPPWPNDPHPSAD
jgi:hypothetical protein